MCSRYEGFPVGSHSKDLACTAGNPDSIPESEGSPEGNESYFINMCIRNATLNLSLGFLFCSIDLYFCLCASTILS